MANERIWKDEWEGPVYKYASQYRPWSSFEDFIPEAVKLTMLLASEVITEAHQHGVRSFTEPLADDVLEAFQLVAVESDVAADVLKLVDDYAYAYQQRIDCEEKHLRYKGKTNRFHRYGDPVYCRCVIGNHYRIYRGEEMRLREMIRLKIANAL